LARLKGFIGQSSRQRRAGVSPARRAHQREHLAFLSPCLASLGASRRDACPTFSRITHYASRD
jgi:hypothetical protein